MRQALVNENPDLVDENHRYVMRITGNDQEGQNQLGNFVDPESKYPVLVTTSRLLSTGVDVQTCQLIVLDREVGSMTEFKQILGRGTRVYEETGKLFFTLMDFRGATGHFADPEFDGDPVLIYEPGGDDPITPPDEPPPVGNNGDNLPGLDGTDDIATGLTGFLPPAGGGQRKVYVNGVGATIVAERVEYLDKTAGSSPSLSRTSPGELSRNGSQALMTSSNGGAPQNGNKRLFRSLKTRVFRLT